MAWWLYILIFLGVLVIGVVLDDVERDRRLRKAQWNLWPYDADGNLEDEPR